MRSQYYCIKQAGQGFPAIIKKSKFIASASPICDEKEALLFLNKIRHDHKKANHNCWAYRIFTTEGLIQNESDDGEPNGTAGQPILYVMEKQEIINTIIVVSRYFGGIKLGKGGLVRAYSNTTGEIIQAIGKIPYKNED